MTTKNKDFNLLFIEHNYTSQKVLSINFNKKPYNIHIVKDLEEAYKKIEDLEKLSIKIDIIITEIILDCNDSSKFCKFLTKQKAKSHIVLSTGYEIPEYIHIMYEHNIAYSIAKYKPSWIHDLNFLIAAISQKQTLNINDYFPNIKILPVNQTKNIQNKVLSEFIITSFQERNKCINYVHSIFINNTDISGFLIKFILNELTFNAIIRAPVDENNNPLYKEDFISKETISKVEMKKFTEKDHVTVQFGVYDDKLILICKDNFGSLSTNKFLYLFYRHRSKYHNEGITDVHGRGIMLISEYVSHLFINVVEKQKTEFVLIAYIKQKTPGRTIAMQYLEQ